MKKSILLFAIFFATFISAQVGIGTATPNPDSDLELGNTNKALLLNRVPLVATTNPSPTSAHTAGMFVYNTATVNDVVPGLYYNDGTKWGRVQLNNDPIPDFDWLLGDTTIDATSFIGTTAASPDQNLSIRASSAEVIRISPTQNVGIRTTTPDNKLDIETGFAGVSGLRLENLPSITSLATNGNGDVISSTSASFINGSMKYSYQAGDHSGWILLDGRVTNTFTFTQQQVLFTLLGINGATPIPNAFDKYLSQVTAGALGSLSGNTGNIVTLAQANLPNVTLSGTTSSNGAHTHTERFPTSLSGAAFGPNQFFNAPLGSGNTSSNGAHTHTITTSSINGGVAQTAVNIKPHTLKLNVFMYVGI